jgi:hypothetical protein
MESTGAFWTPWEQEASSFTEIMTFIERVHQDWVAKEKRRFAWRGQVNAGWPLHSSLYRRLSLTKTGSHLPDESALQAAEQGILADVSRWGLHCSDGGARLPVLTQLALLQHYGAPTRLIDVTFNAWIAVFFAVEEKWSNGEIANDRDDARLFAIDVTTRIINDEPSRRNWPDEHSCPWPNSQSEKDELLRWTSTVYAWKAPPFDKRIAAQNGGFLLGGVPTTQTPENGRSFWPKDKTPKHHWPIDTVRRMTSLAVRAHDLDNQGRKPLAPLFTLKIAAAAKQEIRGKLRDLFGYEHSSIYPDYSGFSSFGTPRLRSH